MKTVILATTIRLLIPLFTGFSIYVLFRGHNDPGGGFIGGLIGSIALVFHAMTHGSAVTRKTLRLDPMILIAAGLMASASSTIISLFVGLEFLTSLWADFYLPLIGRPGTPILFDVGVYLLVIGIVLKVTFTMAEE
jgi:multicomponent Na+:H+ antiporter subunit B